MRAASVSAPVPDLLAAAQALADDVDRLRFAPPVHTVYNPLRYAWDLHAAYLGRFGGGRRRVVFLGMNPGPFGMAQTGVPFGEVAAVRDWLALSAPIGRPAIEHPKRPVTGLACARSEVSGRRLWGLFRERFGAAEAFFADHFVVNYCPLAFMDTGGRNLTPDGLPAAEREALYAPCDAHLRRVTAALGAETIVGIGRFACERAQAALGATLRCVDIPHPSPANPAANRGWSALAAQRLVALGVWPDEQGAHRSPPGRA